MSRRLALGLVAVLLLALTAFTGAVGLYSLASWIFPDAGGAAILIDHAQQ